MPICQCRHVYRQGHSAAWLRVRRGAGRCNGRRWRDGYHKLDKFVHDIVYDLGVEYYGSERDYDQLNRTNYDDRPHDDKLGRHYFEYDDLNDDIEYNINN